MPDNNFETAEEVASAFGEELQSVKARLDALEKPKTAWQIPKMQILTSWFDKDRWLVLWLFVRLYFWNLFVALDQLANAAFFGDPDETISSRAGKARAAGKRWACILCKFLDWIDPQHCHWTQEHDEGRDTPFLRTIRARKKTKDAK